MQGSTASPFCVCEFHAAVFEGRTHFVTGYSKSRYLPVILSVLEHHFHTDESISRQMGTVAFAHSAEDCCCFLCVCICVQRPENNSKRHSSGCHLLLFETRPLLTFHLLSRREWLVSKPQIPFPAQTAQAGITGILHHTWSLGVGF